MLFDRAKFEAYLKANRERFLAEFAEIIAIPSVAADQRDTRRAALWIRDRLQHLGAQVTVFDLPGSDSPIVFAEIGSGERTLMVYNHYDVQPEVPLDLWESPPFELTQRDDRLFGRGVVDNKGELLARIQAVESWLATQDDLPIRLKFVLEGEEEIGSVHLEGWARQHTDILQADGCWWEGGGRDENDLLVMSEGCKGMVYFELHAENAERDLHSSLASLVANPAWTLIWALATMKDRDENITIDGFQAHIRPVDDDVLEMIRQIPFDDAKLRAEFGTQGWIKGQSGNDAQIHHYISPTMNIAGIDSGYGGVGAKAIVPAKARAKIDFRLVPDLTPDLVETLMREHLDRHGFEDIRIVRLAGEHLVMNARNSLVRRAAIEAVKTAFDEDPIIAPWFTATGPVYPLSAMLDIPVISGGTTWHPGSRGHAPNENIYTEDYFNAIRLMVSLVDAFGQVS